MIPRTARFALAVSAIAIAGLVRAGSQGQPSTRTLTIENITGRQTGARQVAISPDGRLVAIAGDAAAGSRVPARTRGRLRLSAACACRAGCRATSS